MMKIERDIERYGGIAATSELLWLGHDPELLRMLSDHRRIIRIRKGWYGSRNLPESVVMAWRVGGTLTCLSALQHYGIVTSISQTLHVRLAANSSRLRNPRAHRVRLADKPAPELVLHWGRGQPSGDRQAVSRVEASAQLEQCEHPDAARLRGTL
jgi:hypothetical protein